MQLIFGALALFAVWRFLPGIRRSLEEAPKGSAADWLGLLLPIGLVIGFVILMLALL
jgi:hypothetical protein